MSFASPCPDSAPQDNERPANVATEYGSPFDDADADIILRSCDGCSFRAHRLMLSRASPVFAHMFSFPTAKPVSGSPISTTSSDTSSLDGLTIVEMSEHRRALMMLLLFIYPYPNPAISGIEELVVVLRLADKFQADVIRVFAEETITHNKFCEPQRLFAVGWVYRSRRIVAAAAKATLLHPVTHPFALPKEFDDIPASAYFALLDYHRKCSEAASLAIHRPKTWEELRIAPASNLDKMPGPRKRISVNTFSEIYLSDNVLVPGVVGEYVERASALLRVRPDPSTIRDLALWSSFPPEVYSNHDTVEELRSFISRFQAVLERELSQVQVATPF